MTETPQPKPRIGLAIWLIVSQLLAVGSLFFWLIFAAWGLIAYGANDLSETPTFATGLWLYPIFPLVMAIAAWVAFAKRKNVLSATLSGLSFAPVALLIFAMWVQTMVWNWTK
jgi:uncharacterized membrane protein